MNRSVLLLLIISFKCLSNVNGQGCSDAGFCTINSFKPDDSDSISTNNNYIKIGATYGAADHSISTIGNLIEYDRRFNKLGLNLKFTTLSQAGNDISVFGYSDLFFNVHYDLSEKVTFTIGTKIPFTDGNKMEDSLPLPMDYQSSLGTFDLFAGVGYKINKLQFVIAFQQPLSQNKNQFFASLYPTTSPLVDFQSTNEFKRSSDVLLRASYPFTLGKSFVITPSLLPIYHLNNDKYTDESGIEREITGSQGLTLNGNLYIDFNIDSTSAIQLILGAPFIVRDARPDGLTRSFIASLEYKFMF